MEKIKLLKMNALNIKEIGKIYMEEYSNSPFKEPWTLKKAMDKINLFSNYCDIWEIHFESSLVGFIIINPTEWCPGEVIFGEEMAIRKDYQRKGIATKTFDFIFDYYKKKGFKKYIGIVNCLSKSEGLHNKIGAKKSKTDFVREKLL